MANAYSTPINYGRPINTTDLAQYVGSIQQGMQQKFDINLAKIDDLISKVATVPLVRDKDKKYLGEKLQGLLSMVDANSKVDLTDNVVARQISSYITSAIDDNVKEQLANSQKISNYQQTAAQRKKDKPELYSDANYTYGLDKSGYKDYINGDTDTLGSMDYIDNYDINKNFTEKLEAFAKERGFEKVLSDGPEGGYIYRTVKGKQLSEQEIANFFDNQLATDPKLKQQFIINSHYNYRGLSDADIIKAYKEQADPILKDFDTKITSIDEKLKNVSADDKATADLLHREKSQMQQQKSDFSSQLDTKNFNRDSFLYGNYVRDIKKSYINTYAYSAITDVTRDDFLLDLAKQKTDGEDNTTTSTTGSSQPGKVFKVDVPNEKVTEAPNYLDQFNKTRTDSWNGLQSAIAERLQEEGKKPTVENITAYYTALKTATKNGVNLNAIKGYDTQILDAFNKVVDANKTSYRLSKVAKDTYGKATNEILTGLFGGKAKNLNLEGLAITAPYTADLLKKYKSVNQMSQKEKAIALYELADNIKENVLTKDEDKSKIDFYLQAIKKENKLSGSELKKIKPADSGSFWGGYADVLQGGLQTIWNTLPATVISTISGMGDFSGEDMEKGYEEDAAGRMRGLKKVEKGANNLMRGLVRAFTSDADLSEIESGDIALGKYKGVTDTVEDIRTTASSRFDEVLKKGAKNELSTYAIVLNPAIKKDQDAANQVSSAIVNAIVMGEDGVANAGPPVKDSPIKISDIKNGIAQVTYTQEIDVPNASGTGTKKGSSQITVPVPVENLPKEITENLDTQVVDYTYSGKNKSGMKQIIEYSPPQDLDSKYNFTKNYIKNYGSSLSQEDIAGLQVSGMQDVKTKEDYLQAIDKILPAEYAKDFVDKHLNSKYKVEWERPEGAGAGFLGHLIKDGKRISTIAAPSFDYNQSLYSIYTMKGINEHLEKQISDYRLKALKLRN